VSAPIATTSAPDDAGEVDAECERRLRLQLVLPGRQQQVGKADAEGVYVDDDLVLRGARLGYLDEVDAAGALEPDNLDSAHSEQLLDSTGSEYVAALISQPWCAPDSGHAGDP